MGRGFFHAVAGGGNLNYVFGFCAFGMGKPAIALLAIAVSAAVGLGMGGIFQRVGAVGNADII